MDVGWQLIWVVVTILVGQLVTAAVDIEHLHTRNLQAQGLLTDTQALLSFKQKIEMDPAPNVTRKKEHRDHHIEAYEAY